MPLVLCPGPVQPRYTFKLLFSCSGSCCSFSGPPAGCAFCPCSSIGCVNWAGLGLLYDEADLSVYGIICFHPERAGASDVGTVPPLPWGLVLCIA